MGAVKKSAQQTQVYQLKITLKDIRPPIWRRIQVTGNIDLGKLHDIIQTVMGWSDYHLHQFWVGEECYGTPDPEFGGGLEMKQESRAKLEKIVRGEKMKFAYEYDFGDDWWHEILVEKVLAPEPGKHYPVCLTGRRACPPEDVGGPWGYDRFLDVINDPNHPEHQEMLEWGGEDFDSEAFDLEAVNEALRKIR